MTWTIDYLKSARKDVAKLPKEIQYRIRDYLHDHIAHLSDVRRAGQPMSGERFAGKWRYRVGDYRIICEIHDDRVVVLVIQIGHRREV